MRPRSVHCAWIHDQGFLRMEGSAAGSRMLYSDGKRPPEFLMADLDRSPRSGATPELRQARRAPAVPASAIEELAVAADRPASGDRALAAAWRRASQMGEALRESHEQLARERRRSETLVAELRRLRDRDDSTDETA
jgi:hypothetical protein